MKSSPQQSTPNPKPDRDRRKQQAEHFARIIAVHHETRGIASGRKVDGELAESVAKKLGCSSRTVYRDIVVLRAAYEILGTNCLDAQ